MLSGNPGSLLYEDVSVILVLFAPVLGHCLPFTFLFGFACWFEMKIKIKVHYKSNRKAMNRNWSNQKANPALKTKTGNK